MTASFRFVESLRRAGDLRRVARLSIKLYASLALTGRGHDTDRAVIFGLMGFEPACFDKGTSLGGLAVNVVEC